MTFALPIALLLAGLALPIVGLYILKVRLRRIPVSTNLFWKQIYDEKPPRSIWQNLRHLVSLLAQLLMLGLLVLAIADPYFPWQRLQDRRIVLVIDPSASMQSRDILPTRFDAAIAHAQQFVSGMREGDQAAIVLATATPQVVVGMSNHPPTLRRAIDSIKPTSNATHLKASIELGKQLVGDHPHGEVVVLTDGCSDEQIFETVANDISPKEKKNDSDLIRFVLFGSDANNVGITAFQVRRTLRDIIGYEIMVALYNASTQPIQTRLEISLEDATVDILPIQLQPGEHWTKSLEKTSMEGGTLAAKLTAIEPQSETTTDKSDTKQNLNGLSSDDVAWAILPAREVQKVLLVTPGNWFLQKVFEANPLVELTVRKDFPAVWPSDSIVVLHRTIPPQLMPGNLLVIDPENDCDLWTVGGVLENPIVTEQADASPLMTHIRMDNVLVPEARKLQFTTKPTMLAGTVSGDSIYSEVKRDSGKCLVLGVNLEQSDLAFRTSFPIMISNALSWFAGQSDELHPSLATGSRIAIDIENRIPSGLVTSPEQLPQLHSPSGKQSTIHLGPLQEETTFSTISQKELKASAVCSVGPFDEIGIWKLTRDPVSTTAAGPNKTLAANTPAVNTLNAKAMPSGTSELIREIAVNLANQRESDLRPAASFAKSNSADPQSRFRAARWFVRPFWFYLATLAALFTAIEWFLYQRRLIS